MKSKFFLFALLTLGFGLGVSGSVTSVKADEYTTQYTSVLSDLERDQSFDASDFSNSASAGMEIIQIAESNQGELFVYTCQSNRMFRKKTGVRIELNGDEFDLELLSSESLFDKYLVKDFSVSNSAERYYEISSFTIKANNIVSSSEEVLKIDQKWTATTIAGVPVYHKTRAESEPIENFSIGSVTYKDGFSLYGDCCDAWYIAFSTPYSVNALKDAKIEYSTQLGKFLNVPLVDLNPTLDAPIDRVLNLSEIDNPSVDTDGLSSCYTWNRVQSVSSFLSTDRANLSAAQMQDLNDKQWIFRFAEMDYKELTTPYDIGYIQKDIVSSVSSLTLEFVFEEQSLNLGLIENEILPLPSEPSDSTDDGKINWSGAAVGIFLFVAADVVVFFVLTKLKELFK